MLAAGPLSFEQAKLVADVELLPFLTNRLITKTDLGVEPVDIDLRGTYWTRRILELTCGMKPAGAEVCLAGSGATIHEMAALTARIGKKNIQEPEAPIEFNDGDYYSFDPDSDFLKGFAENEALGAQTRLHGRIHHSVADLSDFLGEVIFPGHQFDTVYFHRFDPEILSNGKRGKSIKDVKQIIGRMMHRVKPGGQLALTVGTGNTYAEVLARLSFIDTIAQASRGRHSGTFILPEYSPESISLQTRTLSAPPVGSIAGIVIPKAA